MVDAREGFSAPISHRLRVFKIIATTFAIFGRAPAFFIVLSLIAATPGLVRIAILGAAAQTLDVSAAIIGVINFLTVYFFQAAMIDVSVRLQDGADFALGDAFRVASRRFLPLLGTGILVTLAVSLGSVLLIVPGLIFLCMFAVAAPVSVLEPLGPIDSMKRSNLLTKGSRWRLLGLNALFFVPIMIISVVNSFVLMRSGHVIAGLVLNAAISVFWAPLATILGAVIYVELRRLKDHLGFATVFD